jgi:hypothetical protein
MPADPASTETGQPRRPHDGTQADGQPGRVDDESAHLRQCALEDRRDAAEEQGQRQEDGGQVEPVALLVGSYRVDVGLVGLLGQLVADAPLLQAVATAARPSRTAERISRRRSRRSISAAASGAGTAGNSRLIGVLAGQGAQGGGARSDAA